MSHTYKLVHMFRQQFEADGDAYIYRRSSKGAAYRVSASEYEEFVSTFRKQVRWLILVGPLVLIGLMALPVFLGFGSPPQMAMLIFTLAFCVPFLFVFYRIWNAPERQLQHRIPVAPALSAKIARRNALKKISWPNLGAGAVVLLALPYLYEGHRPAELLMPENRLWLAYVLVVTVFLVVQTWRKWRAHATPEDDGNQPLA